MTYSTLYQCETCRETIPNDAEAVEFEERRSLGFFGGEESVTTVPHFCHPGHELGCLAFGWRPTGRRGVLADLRARKKA